MRRSRVRGRAAEELRRVREERQEQDPHAWIYGPHAEARRQQRDTSGSGLRDDAGDGGVPAHGRAVPGYKCPWLKVRDHQVRKS